MKQQIISLKVVPDERRVKGDNRFPLKLRITYKGKRKYYGTGFNAGDKEWEEISGLNAKGLLKKVQQEIIWLEKEATTCATAIVPFSFARFEHEFFAKKIVFENVDAAYKDYINTLKANDQYGTASSYESAISALKRFKKNIQFPDVTPAFLQRFEKWMTENGKSQTTTGIYLRTLRSIFNLAKTNGIVKEEDYPFGRRKYVIPTGKNIKKALSIEQIKQIFEYPTIKDSPTEKAKDFWIFSYLCNGINIMDLALLRWENIDAEKITFERAKTKRTKKANPVVIVALRNHYLDAIIKKWGNGNKEGLIFSILADKDTGAVIRDKVKLFTHVINEWMKKMGVELGFDLKLTSYVARHSFATILVRGGGSLALASQSLGHSSIITTQKYFAGFDLRTQAEYMKALTAF